MRVDVPLGYSVFGFSGTRVVPGTRIHLQRETDKAWCIGIVQRNGALIIQKRTP